MTDYFGDHRSLDYTFDEAAAAATNLIQQGATVYQKFTCANCGSRQTIATPNTFHKLGECEECNHITDIKATGCNYVAIFRGFNV